MSEETESTLKEEIQGLKELMESGGKKKKKKKKFRMPLGARVGKGRLRQGYITVQLVNENKNVEFKREPIVDGTINLGDTYHAVDENDIFFYKGKPMIIQPKHRINPYNPINPRKETFGHKWIMARMRTDVIKKGRIGIGGMLIFGVIIAAIAGYYFFFGGA
jgi:hypothetical protein